MSKKALYHQQNISPPDSIKPTDSSLVNKSSRPKELLYNSDNHNDTLIKLIEQDYDATSYIYSIAGGPVPLSDNFLNPKYFKQYNNTKKHPVKAEQTKLNNNNAMLSQTDYLLMVLLLLVGAIGFVRVSTKSFISRLFSSVLSFSFARIMYNERNRLFNLNDFILLVVYYISGGIIFVAISDYLKIDVFESNKWLVYIGSSFFIFLITQAYKLIMVLFGLFVDEQKNVSEYLFYFNNILKLLSILNVIFLFGILFAPENTKLLFILLIVLFYLIASILRVYKIISVFLINRFSLFYLILYFCALEIAPILVLGKLFLGIYHDKLALFDFLF